MTPSEAPDYTLVPPLFEWAPPFDYTLGPEVAEVAALAGLPPDPEQRLILDAAFGVRRRKGAPDKSAARDVGVCAPRQNLKTGCVKQMTLGWIYVLELPLVTWTAHKFDTSQTAFRDMRELIESTPDLDREVQSISTGKGSESIVFSGNRRLAFKARTSGGSRGVTGNRVVLDESMYVVGAHLASLAPTLRAVPDPQLVFAGSAGFSHSAVWRRLRDRGRAGGDPFLSWHEWASDAEPGGCAVPDCNHAVGTEGCALDDPERLARANSALGRRISLDSLAADRLTIPPNEYAVETLGWWEALEGSDAAFDATSWAALTDPGSRRAGPIVLAVDVDPDRTQGAIAMYGTRADGLGHSELVQHGYGVAWIIPRLLELRDRHQPAAIVVAAQAPAAGLAPDMIAAGIDVTFATQSDYARACGAYSDAVRAESLRHIGQAELTASMMSVTRRPAGDAYVWNRRGGGDITSAVAVTLARWGYVSREEVDVPEPSVFFFGDLLCDECECSTPGVPPGDPCPDCQHVHEPADEEDDA